MSIRDNLKIWAYNGVAKTKPLFILAGIGTLVHFFTGPLVYGFSFACWWVAINWLHYPADTNFSGVLVAAGVVWFVTMVTLAYVIEWLYELLRHSLYRPYVGAMMRKFHDKQV